ncbi:MAG: glycosyltransferase [Anaeromyxobacteraceae bacterium]
METHALMVPHPSGRARTLSTLHWPLRRRWMTEVEVLDRGAHGPVALAVRLGLARGYDAVVIDGATGGATRVADLGAAAVLARRPGGPAVVVTDATWKRGVGALDRAACKLGLLAIDSPRTTYCVLSSEERRLFPRTWGVDPERVEHTPFYFTASDEELAAPVRTGGGVFAGGDSLRDYRPLVEAARGLPARVTLATGALPAELAAHAPPNVAVGRVTPADYMALMRAADVVVVALAPGQERSAGQQNYLNAMAFGKVVIVPDVMGVRDHVEPGATGLVVPPGEPRAMREAIEWALSHPAEAAAMGARAREVVRQRFTPDRYVAAVLGVVERAVGRLRAARRGLAAGRSA